MEIWDATTEVFSVHMTRQGLSSLHLPVVKSNYPNREQAWARLKDITKMSENEFKDDPATSGQNGGEAKNEGEYQLFVLFYIYS